MARRFLNLVTTAASMAALIAVTIPSAHARLPAALTRMFLRGLLLLLSPDIDGHDGVPRAIQSQDRGCKHFVVGKGV